MDVRELLLGAGAGGFRQQDRIQPTHPPGKVRVDGQQPLGIFCGIGDEQHMAGGSLAHAHGVGRELARGRGRDGILEGVRAVNNPFEAQDRHEDTLHEVHEVRGL